MGTVIRISMADLPAELARGEERIRDAIYAGTIAGAHRGRAFIVRRTPTDRGQLRAGWRVRAGVSDAAGATGIGVTLAELVNDAPTIAIVELGARPHRVSPEGWIAIYEWVRRHFRTAGGGVYVLGGAGRMIRPGPDPTGPFKGPDPRISAITNAIVWKIRKQGQKPTFFVRNSVDDLRMLMATELHRAIGAASRAAKGKP